MDTLDGALDEVAVDPDERCPGASDDDPLSHRARVAHGRREEARTRRADGRLVRLGRTRGDVACDGGP